MTDASRRGRPPWPDVLTPAEWRVVDAVRHGMSNPLIARRQGVSVDAVKFHLSNALTKLGLENRRQLRRWTGVREDSALGRTPPGASETIRALKGKTMPLDTAAGITAAVELGPIGQIGRSVADIAAAEAWYRDVLGLKHLYTFGNLAFFDCGGVRLFLEQGSAPTPQSVIYFRVGDIREAHTRLAARGIEFVSAPHLIHRHADGMEEWMAFFNDNEGRTLAIMSQVRP
jgi:DNA-binding CsgD family transcriptional regulator/catechol 2,3-dioxygenase-like lactoylglutathione lyase family enzyme